MMSESTEIIELVNKARKSHGLSMVEEDPRLSQMAQEWAYAMSFKYGLTHGDLGYRLAMMGLEDWSYGECVACGLTDSKKTYEDWFFNPPITKIIMPDETDAASVMKRWFDTPEYSSVLLGAFGIIGVGHYGSFWCVDLALRNQ